MTWYLDKTLHSLLSSHAEKNSPSNWASYF